MHLTACTRNTAVMLFLLPCTGHSSCTGSRGEITACHLNMAYHNETSWCGHNPAENRNAALCSGVLLRGVTLSRSRTHHAWDLRPTYAGVSFSYLRKDQNFGQLAYSYQTGFIVYPYDHTPAGKTRIELKCAFPFDGDTINRRDFCGQDANYRESNPCYRLSPKINTAAAWVEYFDKNKGDTTSGGHSCGFMLDEADAREQFRVSLQSRNDYLARHEEAFNSENEVVLKPWSTQLPKRLPVEAFFYLKGSSAGLESAQTDQMEFYQATDNQERVPVISLQLPVSNKGEARFTFSPSDQKLK